MKDVIYVPVEGLEVVQEFVDVGWSHDGRVQVADVEGTVVSVVVLSRPMSPRQHYVRLAEDQTLPALPEKFRPQPWIDGVYEDGWRHGYAWLKRKIRKGWRKVEGASE